MKSEIRKIQLLRRCKRDQPSNGEERDEDLRPGEQPGREQTLEQNLFTGEWKQEKHQGTKEQQLSEKKKKRKHQRDL